jgi:release factor glutamine methyltransferase
MSPRPATEALVDAAAERIGDRAALVADVGTGSGAVAFALALRAPHARLWATDTSPAAVALARANVCWHQLGERISVLRADLLERIPIALRSRRRQPSVSGPIAANGAPRARRQAA